MERDFKGVWIPKEIWLSKELNLQEKVFLVEIDSLDNEEGCFASNAYFAEFFQLSKNRCSEIIKSLEKKGLVTISYIREEGKKSIEKRIIKVVDKSNRGTRETDKPIRKVERGYSKKGEDNNTSINNINNNIFLSDSKEYRLADYLRKYILKNNPTAKVPNDDGIQKWCKTMGLMLRRDKRTMEDIKEHIQFSQTDTFWMANILSPTSLRKQYDKLTMKIKGGNGNGQHSFNSQQNKETGKWAGFKPQTIETDPDYDFNDPDIM